MSNTIVNITLCLEEGTRTQDVVNAIVSGLKRSSGVFDTLPFYMPEFTAVATHGVHGEIRTFSVKTKHKTCEIE